MDRQLFQTCEVDWGSQLETVSKANSVLSKNMKNKEVGMEVRVEP